MLFRRKMFKKQNNIARKIIKFLIFIIISIAILFHYDNSITDIIVGISIKNAEDKISKCASQSVEYIIDELNLQYSDIINTNYNNGTVVSITANTPKVNKIKSKIILKTQKLLKKYSCLETVVQLGSLSGFNMLSNRGPDIHILYDLYCSTTASIDSKFRSSGLNQTCHSVIVNVAVKYCLVLNDGDHVSTVNNDFIIAETVIVGEVPEAYGTIYGLTTKDG